MKLLEERIKKDGKVYPGDILKIDSFLNHQIDIKLLEEIGKEIKRLFPNEKPTKILTIEASGIAIASIVDQNFDYVPVIFAKKNKALNMSGNVYASQERSYTRGEMIDVQVSKEYLNENDTVLIVDDFLANGEAMNSLIDICNQANAKICGCCAIVCKTYQPGEERIKKYGVHLECLARVKSMTDDGQIEFEN